MKSAGQRTCEAWFKAMNIPVEWERTSIASKAAWEVAAEEAHIAHTTRIMFETQSPPQHAHSFTGCGQLVPSRIHHLDEPGAIEDAPEHWQKLVIDALNEPGESANDHAPKPIDWLAINKSCS